MAAARPNATADRDRTGRGVGGRAAALLFLALLGVAPPSQADDALARQLAGGGYNLFWRHTYVGKGFDTIRYTLDEAEFAACELQRNLDASGRADASAVGAAFKARGITVSEVIASPYCRTRETAEIAFGAGQVRLDPLIGTVCEAAGEAFDLHTARLRELLSTPPPQGANRVLVSHNCNIRALAAHLEERCAREPEMGDAVVFRAVPGEPGFEFVACLPLARMRSWQSSP